MLFELVTLSRFFHGSHGSCIWNLDPKGKSIAKDDLGVKHPNGLCRTQPKVGEDCFCPLLDIRINATMNGCGFHTVNYVSFGTQRESFPQYHDNQPHWLHPLVGLIFRPSPIQRDNRVTLANTQPIYGSTDLFYVRSKSVAMDYFVLLLSSVINIDQKRMGLRQHPIGFRKFLNLSILSHSLILARKRIPCLLFPVQINLLFLKKSLNVFFGSLHVSAIKKSHLPHRPTSFSGPGKKFPLFAFRFSPGVRGNFTRLRRVPDQNSNLVRPKGGYHRA